MFIQTNFFRHSGILPASLGLPSTSLAVCSLSAEPNEWLRRCVNFEMLSSVSGKWNYAVQLNGTKNASFLNHSAIFSSSEGQSSSVDIGKKRKVVEHVCLLKAKEDLSDEKEEDMLDYLYTSQYQMGGIVAVSLGRISDENPENYTHALYMRFQRKEDLTKFYSNPFYSGVLKDYVMPYCHVCPDMV